MSATKLRVLLVPDTKYWILGRIAVAIAGANPWIEATVVSGEVLRELLRRSPDSVGPFDLVHFVLPGPGQALLRTFASRMPVVTSMHHFDETQPLETIEQGDAICVVASEWRTWFRERNWLDDRLWLVPNGVDTECFHPWPERVAIRTRQELGIDATSAVIGFVGKPAASTCDRKGSDVFLEALRLLGQRHSNVTALVIGPGWDGVKRAIESTGVRCVSLPFVFEHTELSRMYAAMDLYWITARIEGGPCTLLEAMSTGTCVVTTPVGMARDIVRDGENAVIVPIGDAAAVAERSMTLLHNSAMRARIGSAARASMVGGYDWTQTAPNVWELYRRAIKNWRYRTDRPILPNALPAQPEERPQRIDWQHPHLAGVQPKWRSWVRAKEDLLWMTRLAQLGEPTGARKLAQSAVLLRPFDREVWRSVQGAFPNSYVVKALTVLNRLTRLRK